VSYLLLYCNGAVVSSTPFFASRMGAVALSSLSRREKRGCCGCSFARVPVCPDRFAIFESTESVAGANGSTPPVREDASLRQLQ